MNSIRVACLVWMLCLQCVFVLALAAPALSETSNAKVQEYFQKAAVCQQQNDFRGGLENINKAIKLDPNNGKLYALSSYFKSGLGDYQGALRDATKGVQIAPKDVINYSMRADAYFHLGKVKEAIADRNIVIALQPNNPISYCGAAAVYMDIEDFDAAQKLITKALKLDPNHDYAREMAGRLSKAMLKKAVAESKTKNWTRAIGYANSAVQLSPKYGDAYAVRAQLKLWSGDKAGAAKDCDAAEKLHCNRELVSSVRAGLKSGH